MSLIEISPHDNATTKARKLAAIQEHEEVLAAGRRFEKLRWRREQARDIEMMVRIGFAAVGAGAFILGIAPWPVLVFSFAVLGLRPLLGAAALTAFLPHLRPDGP